MNILFLVISLIFGAKVLASGPVAVVTVIHPNPVTVTYDPVAGRIIPPSSVAGSGESGEDQQMMPDSESSGNGKEGKIDSKDVEGKVNAKATASIITRSKLSSMRSTGMKSTSAGTESTTDTSSAFRMSLPFAFGTFAAVVLAAIVF